MQVQAKGRLKVIQIYKEARSEVQDHEPRVRAGTSRVDPVSRIFDTNSNLVLSDQQLVLFGHCCAEDARRVARFGDVLQAVVFTTPERHEIGGMRRPI